jgi:YebC/PmpR family DNA-binding regulatory protein
MAGHSKWANIKHRKGRQDERRGKVFAKIAKQITVAARLGGGDPAGNPRLRLAMDKAREVQMPKDNVDRAIRKGTGEGMAVTYEEVTYEGYGPGGAAVMVEVLTDNRNRIVAEVRHAFSKNRGNLGENGCVAWLFDAKGYLAVPKEGVSEDRIMEVALEAGAEDVGDGGDLWEVTTEPEQFHAVKEGMEGAGLLIESADLTRVPKTTVRMEGKEAEQMLRLMEMLEDNDDVQHVYSNFDIDDEEMERLAESG